MGVTFDYVEPTQWYRNFLLHPDGKHFPLSRQEKRQRVPIELKN